MSRNLDVPGHYRPFLLLRWTAVAILFFSQMASTPGVMELVLHMKSLVTHYREHNLENQGLTFTEFLKLHYGAKAGEHHEEHDHSGLPFKCGHAENMVISGIYFPCPEPAIWPEQDRTEGFAPLLSREITWHSIETIYDFWQPPRQV